MPLRINLCDARDREWLEKRGVDLKAIRAEEERQARLYIQTMDKTPSERPSKYRNRIVEHEGEKFHSQFELSCWLELKRIEKQKKIAGLDRQTKVTFKHNGKKLLSAVPDFRFYIKGELFYADAKSEITSKLRVFRIIQNHFIAFFNKPMLVFKKGDDIEEIIDTETKLLV